jgi:regulator of protease activity HflC (stomatin/prohibitin superfamily)
VSKVDDTQQSPWLQAGRLAFLALYVFAALAALSWLLSNVREVKPANRVVVLRMGVLQRAQNAGLLLAWPQPFEQVVTLPAAETVLERRVEPLLRSRRAKQADMSAEDDDEGEPVGDALAGSGYLLTGDAGIVQLDVRVFYKVVEPFAYVLQAEHVLPALDRVVTRSAVAVCAARDLDTILVARPELVSNGNQDAASRERLRSDLLQSINHALAALQLAGTGLGIEATRVDVQSSLPKDTANAFNAVLTSSQQADQTIADARTEAERMQQVATQAADRMLEVAHAQASERLAKAQADTSTVVRLAQSIKDKVEPGILLRVYRERVPGILARAGSVTLVNPKDDAHLIVQGVEK